jgi:hypothetical protein
MLIIHIRPFYKGDIGGLAEYLVASRDTEVCRTYGKKSLQEDDAHFSKRKRLHQVLAWQCYGSRDDSQTWRRIGQVSSVLRRRDDVRARIGGTSLPAGQLCEGGTYVPKNPSHNGKDVGAESSEYDRHSAPPGGS